MHIGCALRMRFRLIQQGTMSIFDEHPVLNMKHVLKQMQYRFAVVYATHIT